MKKYILPLLVGLFFMGCSGGSSTTSSSSSKDIYLNKSKNFCMDMDLYYNCSKYKTLYVKKILSNINTKNGNRNFVIWVDLAEYNSGKITDSMLSELADKFLKPGLSNDIYDFDTSIHSVEWGEDASQADSQLIGKQDTINIALYDMDNENLAGYYWAKDIYKSSVIDASNEFLLLYINSEMYIKNKQEIFTTIAHEFTHLINFYQRNIKLGLNDSVWYKEFLAETTENLIASKLEYKVIRYSGYNYANYYPLTNWQGDTYSYSNVHVLGSFLLRNYGGATLLHELSLNNNSDILALEDSTNDTIENILSNLAVAYVASDLANYNSYNSENVAASAEHNFLIDSDGVVVKKIMGSQTTTIHLNIQNVKDLYVAVLSRDNEQEISVSSPEAQNKMLPRLEKSLKITSSKDTLASRIAFFNNHKASRLLNIQNRSSVKVESMTKKVVVNDIIPKFYYDTPMTTFYDDITYTLEAINFYTQDPIPNFFINGKLDNQAILYSKIAKNITGDVDIEIGIEKVGDIILIIK